MQETHRKKPDNLPEMRGETEETTEERLIIQTSERLEEARETIKELNKKLIKFKDFEILIKRVKELEYDKLLNDTSKEKNFIPLMEYDMINIEPPTENQYTKSMQWYILSKRYVILGLILILAIILLGMISGWVDA